MDLTTITRIKNLEKDYQNDKSDVKLAMVISGVSAKIEAFLGRTILIDTYTEQKNVTSCRRYFNAEAYPVTDVAHVNQLSEVGDSDPFVIELKYVSFLDNKLGRIGVNYPTLYTGFGAVEIEYTGGMADDTADFISKYPDIAFQTDMQVLFEMSLMTNLVDSQTAVGDQTTKRRAMDFLPSVKMVLTKYKRKAGLY